MISLSYDKGRIISVGGPIPYGKKMKDSEKYIAPAFRYSEIVKYFEKSGIQFEDNVFGGLKFPKIKMKLSLRDYQNEAIDSWIQAGKRGVVILPTGSGKTVLALKAIEKLGEPVLIVVPTLVLVEQWKQRLEDEYDIQVGIIGGGGREVRAITVATYDSASLKSDIMGNLFMFIIFDEVHHLTSQSYRLISLKYIAPYRLGLTATLQKENSARVVLRDLVGDVVHEMEVNELAGIHLADYKVKTVYVSLSPEDKKEYNFCYEMYRNYLKSNGIQIRSAADYQRFVLRTGRDTNARTALLSRNRAMDIAQNSSLKVEYLKQLLQDYPNDKTLIFTRHNKLVYRISKELLIPAITHQTLKDERKIILDGFRSGEFQRIVTSRVLDEGIDVPDASMAIILSGSGSSRQYIQRLGRILRKSKDKQARLFELVSKDTSEIYMSRRRRS